ncbi:alpha/beta fold hydrolase [Jidongwangia harbinensis]|uniref:alpha/beta fold hydrolase n=1 Tax=Jidongwangia harbinensis TaxID=2878561 RepID=UPI001CDA33DB|nr:alpha/beta fold hydrolase [Jidongwangia harbinensis]MCA2216687.1 alpha/beta fold hydrolase [Jidongwangia harbinensis]
MMVTSRWRRVLAAGTATVVLAGGGTPGTAGVRPAAAQASGFDAATRHDTEFNRRFTHRFADVQGVRMHYVTGGTGAPLVLLHGWPQSWYEWRGIMPELAKRYTVYALDLPGLGDSQGTPSGYDKKTLARYVHGLLADRLGLDDIRLVGHDLGAGVGFQYAAQYPDDVVAYAHLDYPLPGPALSAAQYRTFSWHMAFHTQERIPEAVVDDDVREYLALFYPQVAYGGTSFGGPGAESPFDRREIDEYARTYRRPQVLTGGFNLYRTLDADERDTIAAAPVAVPTLLMTAEGQGAFVRTTLAPRMSAIVRTVEVPKAGHWLPEENPGFVTAELLAFLAGR